ncbi:MAG: RNA polymerase sigma factor [Pirellulales bacterium]
MADDCREIDVRELVVRCLRGDDRAMLALVERHQPQVYGLCYRMVGHRQDAEDVAQETFVRVLRSLAQWDSSREFMPWLLAIAANRCRTLLGRRSKRPTASSDVEFAPDGRPDRHAALQTAEEVQCALVGLREEYRQAFLLFHVDQLSYAEIGAALEVPLGTVKTWVHRARLELASVLRERGVVEGEADAVR